MERSSGGKRPRGGEVRDRKKERYYSEKDGKKMKRLEKKAEASVTSKTHMDLASFLFSKN